MDASYGWDNEGRMTSLTGPGGTDTYAFDVMGRLSSGGATYGPAGELLTFNNVIRTYNNLGQLTRMTASVMDMEYRYTAGYNNGRISQSKDYVTGEEVTYSYDSLNRLSHAETTDSAWGTTYVYDGWRNRHVRLRRDGPPLVGQCDLRAGGRTPHLQQRDPYVQQPRPAHADDVGRDGYGVPLHGGL